MTCMEFKHLHKQTTTLVFSLFMFSYNLDEIELFLFIKHLSCL